MPRLDQLCNIQYGYAFNADLFTTKSSQGVPLVRIRDVVRGYTETYTPESFSEAYRVHDGDILIGMDGEFNVARWHGGDAALNQRVCKITPRNNIHSQYLFYFLPQALKRIEDQTPFVTVKHLSAKKLSAIEVPDISMMEQANIAERLDIITTLLANRRQVDEKLAELPKARFVEMFGDPVVNPMGWEKHPLENIAEVGSSKRVFTDELLADGIPFFRGTEIGLLAEGTAFRPELYISPNHYHKLCEGSGKPARGDLLLPSICPDGRIWLVDTDQPFYFKDGRVLWISKISERTDSVFVQHVLKFIFAADYDRIASGTTFKELKIFVLKKLPIPLPPLDLQRRFAAFARACAAQRAACARQIAVLETLRGKLLQDAFGAAG